MGEVVVTATLDPTALADVPVPTTVISRAQIEAQGAVRVSDLLAEQPGLVLVPTFGGAGIQMQGFDPAYTLILIDGEPVIGREAGTLDLDRLGVAGLERVEIVRGPSSSRFGSDALAGVINLITRRPDDGVHGSGRVRVGSFGASDLSLEGSASGDAGSARVLLNRFGSSGADVRPDLPGQTAPAFADYSGELRLDGPAGGWLGGRVRPALTARAGRERLDGEFALGPDLATQKDTRGEWSVAPRATIALRPGLIAEVRTYAARFATSTLLSVVGEPAPLDDSDFAQTQSKAEGTLTYLPAAGLLPGRVALHAGAGAIGEGIGGGRYAGDRSSRQSYAFGEASWQPAPAADLTLSARYDAHSDYASQLSPRAALLVRLPAGLRLRASAGRGFRAPDFRQRYLAFANAAAGYTVLGSEELQAGLAELDAQGGVLRYLIPVAGLETIRAERSTAYNVGIEAGPVAGVRLRMNAFHNEVRDLIETQPVAVKSNGQSVFSYFNLARIYTRGLDADVSWAAGMGLTLAAGGQLLDTADRDVLDQLGAGTLYRRTADGREVRVARRDYGGLLGRSRYSGTLRVEHRAPRLGLTSSARLVWRSRYGDRDLNASSVLDDAAEYAPAVTALNVTLRKTFGRAAVDVTATNLLDSTDPERRPSDAGRSVLVGASIGF